MFGAFPWKIIRARAHFLLLLLLKNNSLLSTIHQCKNISPKNCTNLAQPVFDRQERKKPKQNKPALLVETLEIWKCKLKYLFNYLLMLETKACVVIYMLNCLQYLSFLSIWRPLEKPEGENQKTGLHSQHSFKFCAADNTDLFA